MSGAYPDRELPKMKAHRCNDRIEDVMQARPLALLDAWVSISWCST